MNIGESRVLKTFNRFIQLFFVKNLIFAEQRKQTFRLWAVLFWLFNFAVFKKMKIVSPVFMKLLFVAVLVACSLSSCKNEREVMVKESVRMINKATFQIQDLDNLELKHLKEVPDMLQDSLNLLQNKHPDVILTDEDARVIRAAMNKFSQAQENAIQYFTHQIDELEESIVQLNDEDDVVG